jgi:hypothetical protein
MKVGGKRTLIIHPPWLWRAAPVSYPKRHADL